MKLLFFYIITIFPILPCFAKPAIFISDQCEPLEYTQQDFKIYPFKYVIYERTFNYIHAEFSTVPVTSELRLNAFNSGFAFIISGQEYQLSKQMQERFISLLTTDTKNIIGCIHIPTCFQVERYLSNSLPDRGLNFDCREKMVEIDNIQDIKPSTRLFLMEKETGNIIHAMTAIGKNIAFSRIGKGRSIFHTVLSMQKSYSKSYKKDLAVVTPK